MALVRLIFKAWFDNNFLTTKGNMSNVQLHSNFVATNDHNIMSWGDLEEQNILTDTLNKRLILPDGQYIPLVKINKLLYAKHFPSMNLDTN